jgi:hypothetical protein
MIANYLRIPFSRTTRIPRICLAGVIVAALALVLPPMGIRAEENAADSPSTSRCGFYLHGAWKYNYPFAVRSWKRADYGNMFQLLKQFGYDTVMLWPGIEAVPAPISPEDRQAVLAYRLVIEDARRRGLEAWLTTSPVTVGPEIAARPWAERSLYAHMKTVRLDNAAEAEAFLQHRAALLALLNNADAYVTIDGDPGGYPGAKPADFVKIFLSDRKTIDRFGTHPETQKVIPWIWSGWGTKGIWQEPIAPFVEASLAALKDEMPEPWEMLPGRSHLFHANKRINFELVEKAGLVDRSTLMLYEAIEYEPSLPGATLQLADIRDYMRTERALLAKSRGCFSNCQTPIMVIPNIYFFARCARDQSYLDRSDDQVLTDLAGLLGGPPELLVPAWLCLERPLDQLAADLPTRLRGVTLTGPTAAFLPGGARQYLNILASQVDSRIRLLRACGQSPKTPQEAAEIIADGAAALVDWWNLHHYVMGGEGDEPFHWRFVVQYPALKSWVAKHVTDPQATLPLVVKEIVARGILPEPVAKARVAELLAL